MDQLNRNSLQKKFIELTIETVIGKPFQIRAYVREKVRDIKERIEMFKGISVSQQRLVWQSTELQDDSMLEDLKIQDGAKITLFPAMRGGPLNYRRVEMAGSINPDLLQKLSEMKSDETNAEKRPVVVMVVHDGQMFNLFQILDSNASFDTMSTSFFDIEEGFEEEDDEEKLKKEENARLEQKVAALRKRMDSIAVDKSKVDLPKPIPPTLTGTRQNSIKKIMQTTSTKPSVPSKDRSNSETLSRTTNAAPSILHPNETLIIPRVSPASSQLFVNRASTLMQQSSEEAVASKKSAFRKSHHLLHDSHRKLSISSNQNGSVSSARFGGSLPQIRTQRSLPIKPIKVRRSSLPGKGTIPKGGFDGSLHRKSIGEVEKTSTGLSSSSLKALDNYLMLVETFPGGSRYHKPLETISSQATSSIQGPLTLTSTSLQSNINEAVSDKKVTRCTVCSKKTGLATTYECRCLKIFCTVHRYPEAHSCTYDYKGEGRKEIKESNPVVVAAKLRKI